MRFGAAAAPATPKLQSSPPPGVLPVLSTATTPKPRGSGGSKKGQPWSESEHLAFITGLKKLGKGNWRGISRYYVPSRTPTQVASHAQKHFMRLNGVTKRKSRFSLLEQAAVSQGLLPGNSSGPQPPSLQQLPQAAAMYHPSAAYSAAFSAPVPLQPGMQPHLIAPVQVFFPGQPMAFMQAPVLVSNACPSILRPVSHLTFAHTEPVHCSQQRLLFQQYASAPSKPLPMPVSQPIASTPLPPAIPPEPEALTTPLPTCMLKPEAFSRSAAPKPVAKVVPAKFSRVCRPTANHAVVRKEDVSCVSKTLSSTLASPSIWAGKPSSHSAFHLTASAATCP